MPQLFFYVDGWILPAAVGSGFWHPESSKCSEGEERAAGCTLTEPATALRHFKHKYIRQDSQIFQKLWQFVCVLHVYMFVNHSLPGVCTHWSILGFLWIRLWWFDSPPPPRHHDVLYAAPTAEEPGPELLRGWGQGKGNWNPRVKNYINPNILSVSAKETKMLCHCFL